MLCPVSVTGAECLTVSDLYRKNRGIDRSGQTLTHFHRAAAVACPVGAAKFCSAAKFCWTFCSTQVRSITACSSRLIAIIQILDNCRRQRL